MATEVNTKRGTAWVCGACGKKKSSQERAEACEKSHHPDTEKVVWAGECEEFGCEGYTMAELDTDGKTLALFCEYCDWREEK